MRLLLTKHINLEASKEFRRVSHTFEGEALFREDACGEPIMNDDENQPKRGWKKPTGDASAERPLAVRVKTAKGRKLSSTLWLERQLNDPYVAKARAAGYRSRAAFKLLELDKKFSVLKRGARIVDLGAAPGGWCQVAAEVVFGKTKSGNGQIIGIDLNEVEPLPGVELLQGDFLDPDCPSMLKAKLGGPADVVLSDMAAAATGHSKTDHLRIIGLAEAAHVFAVETLAPGGAFVAKVLQGGATGDLLNGLKANFEKVRHAKPDASRANSAEVYVVALGFRGAGKRTEAE